jgi:hypothetical protein
MVVRAQFPMMNAYGVPDVGREHVLDEPRAPEFSEVRLPGEKGSITQAVARALSRRDARTPSRNALPSDRPTFDRRVIDRTAQGAGYCRGRHEPDAQYQRLLDRGLPQLMPRRSG